MSTRCESCLSSCGMAVLLADGLRSSTSLHDSGTSRAGVRSLWVMRRQSRGWDSASDRNVLYTDEAGTPDNTCQSLEGLKRLRQSRRPHILVRAFPQMAG